MRAAADIDAFYEERKPDAAPGDHVLVITADAKGIVMLPSALRPATAKAAAARKNKLAETAQVAAGIRRRATTYPLLQESRTLVKLTSICKRG
jgi:hypothetical protein